MKKTWITLASLFLLQLVSTNGLAEEKKFVHIEKEDISGGERFKNFGIMYGIQWGSYLLTQHETISEHGSFQNYTRNIYQPHFDFDGMSFNVFKHSFVGSFYYQFYRSRGYGEGASFLWSVFSSSAFEFTIEALTERPSFQDLYQTPVFGSLLGMGLERVSLYFHSLDVWPARILGYIFNPFSLIPGSSYGFELVPIASLESPGAAVSWRF